MSAENSKLNLAWTDFIDVKGLIGGKACWSRAAVSALGAEGLFIAACWGGNKSFGSKLMKAEQWSCETPAFCELHFMRDESSRGKRETVKNNR